VNAVALEQLDTGGVIASIGEDHVFTRVEDAIAAGA